MGAQAKQSRKTLIVPTLLLRGNDHWQERYTASTMIPAAAVVLVMVAKQGTKGIMIAAAEPIPRAFMVESMIADAAAGAGARHHRAGADNAKRPGRVVSGMEGHMKDIRMRMVSVAIGGNRGVGQHRVLVGLVDREAFDLVPAGFIILS